jgi:rod shape-determining protein MreC
MAVLDIRQRTGWLFVAVTVVHIILISAQVNSPRGIPIIEEVTFGAFAEVQRAATGVVGNVREGWQNYFALQQIRRENEELKRQVAQIEVSLQQERARAEETRTLRQLLQLRQETPVPTVAANVIGSSADAYFRTISIDKGTSDGLRQDMAVIAPTGVVGRIIMPTARAAKVQLLIDRNAAAAGLIERSRAQGVVLGTGAAALTMAYLPGSADIKAGDRVVTAGIDRIYPKGFVIGQIESLQRGAGEFSGIRIKPAVDFSALEAVLVVTAPPAEPETPADASPAGSGSAPAPPGELPRTEPRGGAQ